MYNSAYESQLSGNYSPVSKRMKTEATEEYRDKQGYESNASLASKIMQLAAMGGGDMLNVKTGGIMMPGTGNMPLSENAKVIRIQQLPTTATEADLIDACANFGPLNYVQIEASGTAALVEFESAKSAQACISQSNNTQVTIADANVHMSFASVERIERHGFETYRPGRVLVMTIKKPNLPITVDVINAICKAISQLRMVKIIRKETEALVLAEFEDSESARLVKQRLNGCDIYAGCCSLKIEYAKLSRMNVTRNDKDQHNFVSQVPSGSRMPVLIDTEEIGYDDNGLPVYAEGKPLLPLDCPPQPGRRDGLVPDPFPPYARHQAGGGRPPIIGGVGREPPSMSMYGGGERMHYGPMHPPMYSNGPFRPVMLPTPTRVPQPPANQTVEGAGFGEEGAVILMYGVGGEQFNCQKIFNMLCCYGNVVRIKYLQSKKDACMIQMGDRVAADRVMNNLRGKDCFGSVIQFSLSREPFLKELRGDPNKLPDGTDSYVDYTGSRSNRFLTPKAAHKNRVNPPCASLYLWNVPREMTAEKVKELAKEYDVREPLSIKILDARETAKTVAGTLTFENDEAALEYLCKVNHHRIDSPESDKPFILKLSFSGKGEAAGNSLYMMNEGSMMNGSPSAASGASPYSWSPNPPYASLSSHQYGSGSGGRGGGRGGHDGPSRGGGLHRGGRGGNRPY